MGGVRGTFEIYIYNKGFLSRINRKFLYISMIKRTQTGMNDFTDEDLETVSNKRVDMQMC